MNWRNSILTDALIMVLCGVAFVAGETVLGVLAVQLQHIMIPGNLCQNRSCGDRRGCGIPLDHRYRWDSFQLRRAVPIDIGGVRRTESPSTAFLIASIDAARMFNRSISFSLTEQI